MLGFNLRFEIERTNWQSDDEVGGAVTSGTVVHAGIRGRLQGEPTEQVLLMQGLETDRVLRFTLQPGNLDIRERDYARVTYPTNHPYYNVNLRIVSVTYSNLSPNDRRDYMIVDVTRSVRAHEIQ